MEGNPNGNFDVLEYLWDPGKQKKKRAEIKDGQIIHINTKEYFPLLPFGIKNHVEEMGYVARFFNYPPITFASLIETCLDNNKNNSSIRAYNSSVKKEESLMENLVYYSIIHIEHKPKELFGVKQKMEHEIGIVAVFDYKPIENTSLILISAEDTIKFNEWIDLISQVLKKNEIIREGKENG